MLGILLKNFENLKNFEELGFALSGNVKLPGPSVPIAKINLIFVAPKAKGQETLNLFFNSLFGFSLIKN